MAMTSKLTKSQIILSLLASLLALTPLFSSSLRPAYIYFIFNLLLIALCAEAGLLSSLLSNPNPNYHLNCKKKKPVESEILDSVTKLDDGNSSSDEICKMESRTLQKCSSEKLAATKKTVQLRKCPSTPSIFFIGGGGGDSQVQQPDEDLNQYGWLGIIDNDMEEEEEEDMVRRQELFTKAENFIGNFYKQLNMQREDSWKKIHGFYHKLTE